MPSHEHDQTSDQQVPAVRAPETVPAGPSAASALAGGPVDARAVLSLQRTAGNAGVSELLGSMGQRMGHDFSDVRIHTGGEADRSATALGAHAYTAGTDVVVHSDHWAPGTEAGQRLLAHELTHVVQQKAGPVDGTPVGGGVAVSDPGDRFEQEAERNAERVVGDG